MTHGESGNQGSADDPSRRAASDYWWNKYLTADSDDDRHKYLQKYLEAMAGVEGDDEATSDTDDMQWAADELEETQKQWAPEDVPPSEPNDPEE